MEATGNGVVRGVKDAMESHLIKKKDACPHATEEARNAAHRSRDAKSASSKSVQQTTQAKRGPDDDDDDGPVGGPKRARTAVQARVENFMQPMLKTYRGIDVPFSKEQAAAIEEQFLRATISANLPFRWVEDPEVIALFMMLRSAACDVIPSRQTLSGRLLDEAAVVAEDETKAAITGQYTTLA